MTFPATQLLNDSAPSELGWVIAVCIVSFFPLFLHIDEETTGQSFHDLPTCIQVQDALAQSDGQFFLSNAHAVFSFLIPSSLLLSWWCTLPRKTSSPQLVYL